MTGNGSIETIVSRKARIATADEQPFMREGLRHYLTRQEDLSVCGEADGIGAVMECVERATPDLLILEMRLRNGDVLELLKSLRARFASLRLLIHTQNDETFYAERALRSGAHGYIMKQEQPEEVLAAVRKVLKGELYLSRQMSSVLLSRLLQAPTSKPVRPLDGLSDREFQVFHMLGVGLVNRQIAAKLNLSVKTIETYRENIKHKFGYRNSAELLRHAAQWMQQEGRANIQIALPKAGPSLTVPLATGMGSFAQPAAHP